MCVAVCRVVEQGTHEQLMEAGDRETHAGAHASPGATDSAGAPSGAGTYAALVRLQAIAHELSGDATRCAPLPLCAASGGGCRGAWCAVQRIAQIPKTCIVIFKSKSQLLKTFLGQLRVAYRSGAQKDWQGSSTAWAIPKVCSITAFLQRGALRRIWHHE